MIPTLEDIIRGLADGTMTKEVALRYLAEHVKLQEEVESLSNVPYHRGHVTVDVLRKCEEQDLRWGSNEYPSFDRVLTASADTTPGDLAVYHSLPTPKNACVNRHESSLEGDLTWVEILVCEVAKTTLYYEDPKGLREQLTDVAAVATQWAAQLDAELSPRVEVVEDGQGGLIAHVSAKDDQLPLELPQSFQNLSDHEGPERGP